jgi:quercetin dioxygenase-like cupin family protein
MSRKLIAALCAVGATLALTAVSVLPSAAQTEPPPPIAVELLTPRSTFTDEVDMRIRYRLEGTKKNILDMDNPSRVVNARITVQPGAQFPWHTHPGPVIVNVLQGELVYVQASDCVERSYPLGTAFIDPGRGNVHTAFNPTDEETVLIATFFEVPETGPLTITEGVVPPDDCPIEVGSHSSH